MNHKECIVCLNKIEVPIIKKCKCDYCHDCLLNWLEIEQIKCLNDQCEQTYTFDQLKSIFCRHKEWDLQFEEYLLHYTIRQQPDIRPCPRSECKYYGFMPKNKCKQQLQCLSCGYEWLERSNLPFLYNTLLTIRSSLSESQTGIFEFFWTKRCPKCGIHISKNGGCSHMTCKKCKHYFCWMCMREVRGHNSGICFENMVAFLGLCFYMLINFLHQYDLAFFWVYYSLWLMYQVFKFLLCLGVLVAPIFFFIFLVLTVQRIEKRNEKAWKMKKDQGNLKIPLRARFKIEKYDRTDLLVLLMTLVVGVVDVLLIQYLEISVQFILGVVILVLTVVVGIGSALLFEKYLYRRWMKYIF